MFRVWVVVIFLFIFTNVLAQNIPVPSSWVNDFAGVVTAEYKDKLEKLIQEIEEKAGAEITVVTISSIAPFDEKEYARLLFDSWKPGKKDRDNGVLILLALKERRWRIEIGYGLEGILPDGLCGQIGREGMVPYFKEGNYGKGLYVGASKIALIIAKDAGVNVGSVQRAIPKRQFGPPQLFLCAFGLIFFFIWNLPWPFIIGFPFTAFFAFVLFLEYPWAGICVVGGYLASLAVRYKYWSSLPAHERNNLFGTQVYGGTFVATPYSGGFGGGEFGGGGFGGFGGGGGGGGGAGGGF